MYYKIRKKLIRMISTLRADNTSRHMERWSPAYRLEYHKLFRQYVREMRNSFEITYE